LLRKGLYGKLAVTPVTENRTINNGEFFATKPAESVDSLSAGFLLRDWVPLTERGMTQARAVAEELQDVDSAHYILSSPMTRALQTAAIIAGFINRPLYVEFDLHEWLPDLQHDYNNVGFVARQQIPCSTEDSCFVSPLAAQV
jgi:hypothetical protein